MKTKILRGLTPLALTIMLLSSCYKNPLKDLSENDSRIYITNYDTSAHFSSFKTFSLADSVAILSNSGSLRKRRTTADAQYIAAVENALVQRGFVKVDHSKQPDLGVTVSRIMNTYTQVVNYSNYDYYGSYWDPYYWGYPGYDYYFPTYYGVYNINEEAIAIDIVDLIHPTQNNQLKAIWSGLIRGSGIDNPATIESQVMQLFSQSSYFRAQ